MHLILISFYKNREQTTNRCSVLNPLLTLPLQPPKPPFENPSSPAPIKGLLLEKTSPPLLFAAAGGGGDGGRAFEEL